MPGPFVIYLILSSLILATLAVLWAAGRAVRTGTDRRHEVTAPNGEVWSTRLHWGRPGAGFGLGARLFPRRKPAPLASSGDDDEGSAATGRRSQLSGEESSSRFGWLDWLEVFDEGTMIVLGLVLLVGLVVSAVVIVLLALELVVVLVLAAIVATVRAARRHPWVIETVQPGYEPGFTEVVGLRAAIATNRELRSGIAAGRGAEPV